MAESNLHKLSERGQSVWIDSLSRTMLESGQLAQLMRDDAVVGVTTNTMIFSLQRYREVVEAYLRGLERLVASGGDPSKVHSVASFFVSRVDTEADKRLEALGTKEALGLRGKLAIANAKLAYEHFQQAF